MIFPSCCFWNFDQLLPPAQVPMRSANVHSIRVLQTCLSQGIQIYKAFRGFGLMPRIGAHLIPAMGGHGFTLKYWIASGWPVTSAVYSVLIPAHPIENALSSTLAFYFHPGHRAPVLVALRARPGGWVTIRRSKSLTLAQRSGRSMQRSYCHLLVRKLVK